MKNTAQLAKHQIQVASLISVNQELQDQVQHLRDRLLTNKNLYFEEYLNPLIQQIEQKVKQLEIEATQLKTLNKDLYEQLWSKTKQLESCYQELQHTNQELCQALNSKQVSSSEAITRAKKILRDDQPTREALARLLQVIYDQDVSPKDLGRLRRWTSPEPASARKAHDYPLSKQAIAYKDKHDRIKAQALVVKAQALIVQAQSSAVQARSQRLKAHSQALAVQYRGLE